MTIPEKGETVVINSLKGEKISAVELLGYDGSLKWKATEDGLIISYPKIESLNTSAVFRITFDE